MVAPTLLMRTSSNFLTHDSVEVPFPPFLFGAFYHSFEFGQESAISLVLLLAPVRSRERFARGLCCFKAVDDLLRTIDPRFELFQG